MDDVFKNPETRYTDEQLKMVLDAKAHEASQRRGFITFIVLALSVLASITIVVVAVTGAIGG